MHTLRYMHSRRSLFSVPPVCLWVAILFLTLFSIHLCPSPAFPCTPGNHDLQGLLPLLSRLLQAMGESGRRLEGGKKGSIRCFSLFPLVSPIVPLPLPWHWLLPRFQILQEVLTLEPHSRSPTCCTLSLHSCGWYSLSGLICLGLSSQSTYTCISNSLY